MTDDSDTPDEFQGYDQRPCPNCGQQESHMPFEYTEAMVCTCGQCGYGFLKHPSHLDKPSLNAVPIEELEALADEWEEMNRKRAAKIGGTYVTCAQELRSLIERYGDVDE